MATIYQKISGVDQCLILDSREALLYPFDVGEWNEIKIAAMISLVGNSGDNTPAVGEYIAPTSNSKDKIFFGIKDGSNFMPYSSGSTFFGLATPNFLAVHNATQLSAIYNVYTSGSSQIAVQTAINANRTPLLITNNVTGDTNYLSFLSYRVVKNGNIFSGSASAEDPNNFLPDMTYLRQKIRNASYHPFATWFITGGIYNVNMDNVFIYLPLFESRLRIHNILVEKIS